MRVFRVPPSFAKGKPPVEALKAAGIAFPEGAAAELKDGRLIVHNTPTNLALVEAWIDSWSAERRTVHLTAQAVEFRGDFLKVRQELLPLPSDAQGEERGSLSPDARKSAPETAAGLLQFAGVFTDPQFQTLLRHLTQSGSKSEAVPLKDGADTKQKVFELPAAFGGDSLRIECEIGPDGRTLDLIVQVTGLKSDERRAISTSITIGDGQTFVLGGPPDEGVTRLLFVTGKIEDSGAANREG